MFAVHCPGHGARVLLFSDEIEALVDGPAGMELHWRCRCGATGVLPFGRDDAPRERSELCTPNC